jgi:hypothetical protein
VSPFLRLRITEERIKNRVLKRETAQMISMLVSVLARRTFQCERRGDGLTQDPSAALAKARAVGMGVFFED